jgi:DNA-binding beta-propeller fold protein YncE
MPPRRPGPCATVRILPLAVLMLAVTTRPSGAEIADAVADRVLGNTDFATAPGLGIGPATFAMPHGVAIDRSVTPNRAFVSDAAYHRILGWADVDALANGAPADLVIGQADFFSFGCNRNPSGSIATSAATTSSLCEPAGLAVDSAGRLYVADTDNCRVLVFDDPFGTDTDADLVIGTTAGACNGTVAEPGRLFLPRGVMVDAADNLWVADTFNCRVLEYDGPVSVTGTDPDRVFGQPNFTTRTCSTFQFPEGLALDSTGRLFVGTPSTVFQFDAALTSDPGWDRQLGTAQCNDGGESSSTTCGPVAVATDAGGRLYVADAGNNRVLGFDLPAAIPQAARVFGQSGFTGASTLFVDECNKGGPSATSLCLRTVQLLTLGGTFTQAADLELDAAGRLYVADGLNHRVLRYDTPLASQAADRVLGHTTMDDVRKPVVTATGPSMAIDDSRFTAVVVDRGGSRLLIYPSLGNTFDVPFGVIGQPDLATTGCNAAGRSAASLCSPAGAFVDGPGNLWVADTGNHRVLRYDAPWFEYDYGQKRYVTKSAADAVYGQATFTTAVCAAGTDGLCGPTSVAVDAGSRVAISDGGNHRIVYHVNPLADAHADLVFGQTTFAGTSCNGPASGTDRLCDPQALTYDGDGNLFVADRGNNRVLRYDDPLLNGGGADAVYGQPDFDSTTCAAGAAGLCAPSGVDVDRGGDLLVADTGNDRVVVYDGPLGDAIADRVFGQPSLDAAGCNAGGRSAASLCAPVSVVTTRSGDALFVGDAGNDRALRYDAPFCIDDFALTPVTRRQKVSKLQKVTLKSRLGAGADDDVLEFKGAVQLLEDDGGVSASDEPLLELTTVSGTVMAERVPSLSNLRATNNGGIWHVPYLEGELDKGIDVFVLKEKSVLGTPQLDKLSFKGRAVGQDLGSFTDPAATFRIRWGSVCFSAALDCKSTARGPRCKPAR